LLFELLPFSAFRFHGHDDGSPPSPLDATSPLSRLYPWSCLQWKRERQAANQLYVTSAASFTKPSFVLLRAIFVCRLFNGPVLPFLPPAEGLRLRGVCRSLFSFTFRQCTHGLPAKPASRCFVDKLFCFWPGKQGQLVPSGIGSGPFPF